MSGLKKVLLVVVVAVGLWAWWSLGGQTDHHIERSERSVLEEVPSEENVSEVVSAAVEAPAVKADALETPEKFFYNQLDEQAQVIYRALRDGVAQSVSEIQVETGDAQAVHDIFRRVMFDHPEFFWATGSATSTVYEWTDGRVYTMFKPEYGHTGAAKEAMQAEIERVVEAFLTGLEPGLSEYELVRAVYDYLISTTTYNLEAPDHQNIYSVFVNRESVCAGISRAAQLLLERLGIFATYVVGVAYVPGTSTEPIPHAWNLVRVNGVYYYLDVTWGSPVFQEGSALGERIEVLYDYLLLNEELLFRTHTLDEAITMPPVTSLQHNFFVMNGMFYDEPDEERMLEAMNTSILNQEDWVAFKFATPALYQAMRQVILEDLAPEAARNLAQWHGLESVRYYIREKENLNKITIYWVYE